MFINPLGIYQSQPPGTLPQPQCQTTMREDTDLLQPAAADSFVAELAAAAPARQAIAKIRYSHEDMIDFIITNPGCSQGDVARRYGYTESWISLVMSSDAWKSAMAKRRGELVDPTLLLTINERFSAMTQRSLERLMEKLDAPQVSDNVVLRAVELGAKAMGVGGNAVVAQPPADHLAQLANRLIDLQSNIRRGVTIDVEAC